MKTKDESVEIHYSKEGPVPRVEVVVPYGTRPEQLLKIHAMIEKDILSKISPRGCAPCMSGVHFDIRERLRDRILVDFNANVLAH